MLKYIIITIALLMVNCGGDDRVNENRIEERLQYNWNDTDSFHIADELVNSWSKYTNQIGKNSDDSYVDYTLVECNGLDDGAKAILKKRLSKNLEKDKSPLDWSVLMRCYINIQFIDDEKSERRYYSVVGNWIRVDTGEIKNTYSIIVRKDKYTSN